MKVNIFCNGAAVISFMMLLVIEICNQWNEDYAIKKSHDDLAVAF